jgi:hypothetical protein
MGPKLTVSAENGSLFLQDKNTRLRIGGLDERDFIVPDLDISVRFVTGSDNKATGIIINIMSVRESVARRIDNQP